MIQLPKTRLRAPIRGGNLNGFIEVAFGESQFTRAVNNKNERVLKRSGGYTLAVYRRTVGKAQPKEPDKYLKSGKISARWKKWAERTSRRGGRPPYKGRGARLQKRSSFQVDTRQGTVVIGPHKLGTTTKTPKDTVPALLQEGGRALIKQAKRFFRVKTRFAPHDFVGPVTEKAAPFFNKMMREIPFK